MLEEKTVICPQCGGVRVKVKTGEEFQLEAIDVDN